MTIGLREVGRGARVVAAKLEPRVEAGSPAAALFARLRPDPRPVQVGQTRLVDLTDDDALLASFDKDTRYAVRRSQREGVEVRVCTDASDTAPIDALHALVLDTQRRAGFPRPPLERYRIAWAALGGAGRASILEARRGDELLASGMLVVEGDRSFYLFAGSRREEAGEAKHYASYLLQWEMMRRARELGSRTHDLWGIAPRGRRPGARLARRRPLQEGLRRTRRALGRHLGRGHRPDPLPPPLRGRHGAQRHPRAGPMSTPRSMWLGELADVIGPERVVGMPVGEVTSLAYDSRDAHSGTLFFAVPGDHVDGHDYVLEAVTHGAVGVVAERETPRDRRAAADRAPHPRRPGRCRRRLVRTPLGAPRGDRRDRHRRQDHDLLPGRRRARRPVDGGRG